jgi:acyl-CoA thioesterase-1
MKTFWEIGADGWWGHSVAFATGAYDSPVQYGANLGFVHKASWRMLAALAFLIGITMSCSVNARPLRVLALGDSLTAGYMLPEKDAFPAVLQASLRSAGFDVEVINAGVSGDTSTGALDRLDWALDGDIDAAIVEVGANDMLRGVEPSIPYQSISTILSKLRAKGIKPLLAGMYAAPGMGTV